LPRPVHQQGPLPCGRSARCLGVHRRPVPQRPATGASMDLDAPPLYPKGTPTPPYPRGTPAPPYPKGTPASLKQTIADQLEAVRHRSLALLDPLPEPDLIRQHSPIMSPLVWDLAHVGN